MVENDFLDLDLSKVKELHPANGTDRYAQPPAGAELMLASKAKQAILE